MSIFSGDKTNKKALAAAKQATAKKEAELAGEKRKNELKRQARLRVGQGSVRGFFTRFRSARTRRLLSRNV